MKKASWIMSYVGAGIYIISLLSFIGVGISYFVGSGELRNKGYDAEAEVLANLGIGFLVGGILVFIPLIWSCFYYANKMKYAFSKDHITTICVIALILIGILPGIFALLSDEKEYPKYQKQ